MKLTKEITKFYMAWALSELEKSDLAYMSYQDQFFAQKPTMEEVHTLESKLVAFFKRRDYKSARSSEGIDIIVWR